MESTLFIIIIILLSALSFLSSQSQYVLPDYYFINCGSNSDTYFTGKTFTGDENPTTFSLSDGQKAENNNSTLEIYKTARVFTQKSWYELEADGDNTFVMVNLHFSPFFYNHIELSTSKFNVSVSGFNLLSNFNVGNSTVIKDFIIPIGTKRKFSIVFTPSSGSSPAFVNAIEAFTTPSELFKHGATLHHISPLGRDGEMNNISSSYAFNPTYRINVGGDSIDVDRDTLRRNWIPDDEFLVNSESAKTVKPFEGALTYKEDFATTYDAPDSVYKTAKQLSDNSSANNNVTWTFGVKKNTVFLGRVHICDIITTSLRDPEDAFNLFIYRNYRLVINPGDVVQAVQVPFYYDFVVDSGESGFVNISIGAISRNISQPVLLNGIEIMELLKNSGVDDTWKDGKSSSKKVYVVVGCVVGSVVIVLLIGFFIWFKYRKTKPALGTKTETNTVPSHGQSSYMSNFEFTLIDPSEISSLNLSLRLQFADILQVTNNFDEKLVIGKGGFGKVFRGTFPDGNPVAVKRAEQGHSQGRPEFVKEIMVLSKIRHQHLVSLIGYCDENSEMILVFEYMEKGTLQEHLYGMKKDDEKLPWSKRLEICISAAQGLHYLHTGLDEVIIHRDVKSTNILLDENYTAKVADFGISRLDNSDEGEIDIKGSFGYFDPEYVTCLKLTQKSDVYSFGVVLLEVLCARKAVDTTLPIEEACLAEWGIKQIKNGMVEKIIDPYLVDKINPNSLRIYLETVEKCLKSTGDERPSMYDVLWGLEYALRSQQKEVGKEPCEDSTMTASLQSMQIFDHLPSICDDNGYEVNDISISIDPSESQVFSLLKITESR